MQENIKNRNGSLSGNILKRFNVIFDYQNAIVTLTKNRYFNEKFHYNKSGIELAHDGLRFVREVDNKIRSNYGGGGSPGNQTSTRIIINTQYKMVLKPAFSIVELRENSPAKKAGLRVGDIILSINNKSADQFKLQEVIHMLYGDTGKHIKLKIVRNGNVVITFEFQLEDLFQ